MKGMTAQKLRALLVVAMLLITVGAVVGFTFAQRQLSNYSESINQLTADAQAGDENINTLKELETILANNSETMANARSITVNDPNYADTVVSHISKIARSSGVTITNIGFNEDGSAPAADGSTTPPADSAPAPAQAAPAGVTKKSVSVTISSPLDYSTLMKFLRAVETSKLYMHITNVSIAKETGNNVTTQPFTIEVYLRS